MKQILIFIFLILSNLLYSQYQPIDTIIDEGINKIKIDNDLLYYSTINGRFNIYDLNKKSIKSTLNTFQRVNDIDYGSKMVAFVAGSNLTIIPKDIYLDKIIIENKNQINTLAIVNNNIFYGGKSGKLFMYNINTKSNEEIFSSSDSLYTYWITDIKIDYASNLLFFCAGDFFVYSLTTNKIIFKDTNFKKGYTACKSNGSVVLVSDIKNTNVVSFTIEENFDKKILSSEFMHLLNFTTDSIVLVSANKKTFSYNIINKSVVHLFSDSLSAISNDISENIIGINYVNKIIIYEKDISFIDKPQILSNLNFVAGETIFINEVLADNTLDLVSQKYKQSANAIAFVKIVGHTDYGNDRDNLRKLSKKRADKIQTELVLRKIPSDKIISYGVGDRDTINKKNSDRWKNRRVEVEFITYNSLVQKIEDIKNFPTNKELVLTSPVFLLTDSIFINTDCFKCEINILEENDSLIYFTMLVWFAGTFEGVKYASYDNNKINIIRDVNIRTFPNISDETLLGNKLFKKKSNHEFIEQKNDEKGNLWYCSRLFGLTKK